MRGAACDYHGMKKLTAWTWHLVFYVHNRRLGWSHSDLVLLRQIAGRVG